MKWMRLPPAGAACRDSLNAVDNMVVVNETDSLCEHVKLYYSIQSDGIWCFT